MITVRPNLAPIHQRRMKSKLSILLIEDDAVIRSLLAEALMYQVYEAKDGAVGLEQFYTIQPDVVLLDIIMPGLNGLAVLKEIRRQNPVVGIIMISALNSKPLTLEIMAAGADGYVYKPFDLQELFRKIQCVGRQIRSRYRELHPVEPFSINL